MNLLFAHRKTYYTIYSKSITQDRIEAAITGKRAENLSGTITPEGRFSLYSKGWQPIGKPGTGYWSVIKGKIAITNKTHNEVKAIFYPNLVLLLIIYLIIGIAIYMLFNGEEFQNSDIVVCFIVGILMSLLLRYHFLRLRRNFESLLS